MKKVSAYILPLSEKRQSSFEESLDKLSRFAEAVDEFSYSQNLPLVVIVVSPQGYISHIGNGRRGMRAGYKQRRLNVEELVELKTTVRVQELLDTLDSNICRHAQPRFKNGGILPPKTFEAVVDGLSTLAPETSEILALYSVHRRESLARLTPEQRIVLAYQKDTVVTALNIAGIDRLPLAMWTPPAAGAPRSFLDGLPSTRIREDPMIFSDMQTVPGFDFVRKESHQSAVFQNDKGETLTVILANRLPLEQQTGADLVYYNERFKAFLFVQYKAMETDGSGKVLFRYPNQQLDEEIERMEHVLTQLSCIKRTGSRDSYRLNENPFFLKFCPRLQFEPDSTGLVSGMYLSLGYWQATSDDDAMKGPKGGRHISYQNVGRYLDNTSFATIVANAWVGTTIPQSEILENYIRDVLKSGRAITFAVKRGDPKSGGAIE